MELKRLSSSPKGTSPACAGQGLLFHFLLFLSQDQMLLMLLSVLLFSHDEYVSQQTWIQLFYSGNIDTDVFVT
jgi:hypothetical protein